MDKGFVLLLENRKKTVVLVELVVAKNAYMIAHFTSIFMWLHHDFYSYCPFVCVIFLCVNNAHAFWCSLFFFQLEGVNEPVVLQVFVGNDTGRVKPHGFYQACRVTGRNTTACKEVDIDGTTVIEVTLDPSTNMTLAYVLFLILTSALLCFGQMLLEPSKVPLF